MIPSQPTAKPKAWEGASADVWADVANCFAKQALLGYEDGELDLHEVLRWVMVTTEECKKYRRALLGITAEQALSITPRKRRTRKPKYALCLRNSIANLVIMFKEHGWPVDPYSTSGKDAITRACEWLAALGLCKEGLPEHKTIYQWYLDWKHAEGASLKAGRLSHLK